MKKIAVFLMLFAFFCAFSMSVSAEESAYEQQYEAMEIEDIKSGIDDQSGEFLEQNGLDPADPEWYQGLTAENVFSHIGNFLKTGAKAPLTSGGIILAIMLLHSAICAFDTDKKIADSAAVCCTLSVAAVAANPLWSAVCAARDAVSGSSTFMLSFVPIFSSLTALSGAGVTASSSGAVLLLAAETVSGVAAFLILPLMGCYLAISLCGGVSDNEGALGGAPALSDGIKKLSLWTLTLTTTVFLGVLGIQTAIGNAADSVTVKTAKYIVGTSVPVAGAALSEAAAAVTASMGLLRSSVGIYGVVAVAVIFLPIALELLLWRVTLGLLAAAGDMLSCGGISRLLRAADGMLSVLLGVLALVAAMFIVSLAVVITAGKVA